MTTRMIAAAFTLLMGLLLCSADARAQVVVNAQAAANSIANGNPTRGFGDSDKVDVWIPFQFATGGAQSITSAQIVMMVKPIGQLIGTDSLLLKGASGKVYDVYHNFDRLPPNQWSRVTVDISGNPDVLRAIMSGRLEGCVEDDTAVSAVQLTFNSSASASAPVYAYDLYYYGFDRSTRANGWIRYQSYWSQSDAARAAQYLQASYHVNTSIMTRRWR